MNCKKPDAGFIVTLGQNNGKITFNLTDNDEHDSLVRYDVNRKVYIHIDEIWCAIDNIKVVYAKDNPFLPDGAYSIKAIIQIVNLLLNHMDSDVRKSAIQNMRHVINVMSKF